MLVSRIRVIATWRVLVAEKFIAWIDACWGELRTYRRVHEVLAWSCPVGRVEGYIYLGILELSGLSQPWKYWMET